MWRLLEVKDEQALTTSRLAIDERVLHYLAGVNYLDPRLRPLLRAHAASRLPAPATPAIVDGAAAVLQSPSAAAP